MAADEVSRTSSAYVGRSQRGQSASGQSRPSATKAYYPEQYFNRVGYQRSSTSSVPDQTRSQVSRGSRRVDALGQRVRERFNEELEYPAEEKTPGRLTKGKLANQDTQSNRDLLSRKSGATGASRVQSAILSRRTGLQRDANNSSAMRLNEEKESVITTDKLKRFNDIHGTVAGNMNEALE